MLPRSFASALDYIKEIPLSKGVGGCSIGFVCIHYAAEAMQNQHSPAPLKKGEELSIQLTEINGIHENLGAAEPVRTIVEVVSKPDDITSATLRYDRSRSVGNALDVFR